MRDALAARRCRLEVAEGALLEATLAAPSRKTGSPSPPHNGSDRGRGDADRRRLRQKRPEPLLGDGAEDLVVVASGEEAVEEIRVGGERRPRGGRERDRWRRRPPRWCRPPRIILARSPARPSETSMAAWRAGRGRGRERRGGARVQVAVGEACPLVVVQRAAQGRATPRSASPRAASPMVPVTHSTSPGLRRRRAAPCAPTGTSPEGRDREHQRRRSPAPCRRRGADSRKRAAASASPSAKSASQASVQSSGSASVSRKPTGSAPLAARSETLTASALRAIEAGRVVGQEMDAGRRGRRP